MKNFVKRLMWVLIALFTMSVFTACGSDDDETSDNGGSGNGALVISGTNYGVLPYGSFMNWGDGTASFIFGNQNMASGNIDGNSGYTYVAVSIPCTTGDIPLGTFSGTDVDLDFDVNRILSTEECDLTGWSMDLTMTVSRSGEKFIVDVKTKSLHIFTNDEESGNGESGTLTMHYEGKLSTVNYK